MPGAWVIAPVGMLWTPGYWGWGGGFYIWHPGYWGHHVGFYGGINYGFGYGGVGFFGGEWRGGRFFYNRAVVNVNVRNVTNVYSRAVVVHNTRNVSFNGPGGIEARPSREEEEYSRESHRGALATQSEHEHAASRNRRLFASENHGRPEIAATGRPGDFHGHNIERAKEAGEPYREPKISAKEARVRENGNREATTRQSGGTDGRNYEGNRGMARPESHNARNDGPVNRGQLASRENSNPAKQQRATQKQERQAQKEQKQAEHQAQAEQKRAEKANRAQLKAEQKRNGREQRR